MAILSISKEELEKKRKEREEKMAALTPAQRENYWKRREALLTQEEIKRFQEETKDII